VIVKNVNNQNKERKDKGGQNTRICQGGCASKRLNTCLEFRNSRINLILLGGIVTTVEYTYCKFQISG